MFLSRYFMFIHTNVYVRPSYHLHSTTQRLTSRTGVKEENGFRYSAEFSETSASWSSFSVALVDGLGPTFRVYCLCMTWFLVHPLTWFNLLHIIDVLIFSVRFSVVGGEDPISVLCTCFGHSNQQLFHLNTAWVSSCFGLNGFALGPIQLGQKWSLRTLCTVLPSPKFNQCSFTVDSSKIWRSLLIGWWFKVLTHYLHLSTLFYGVLCIQGGDIFGFLFTINRINRIQR